MKLSSTTLGETPVVTEELALLRRAESGGPDAFTPIMRRYNQRLYRLALALVGDSGEAEDVLQESYVKAYQQLSSFAGRSSLGAWLAKIVRNTAIDQVRARRARQSAVVIEADLPVSTNAPASFLEDVECEGSGSNPESVLAEDEMRYLLEQAIASLPVQFRTVFMLREVEGLSLRETAETLGIPVATVKTRDHRARVMLREQLDLEFEAAKRLVFPFLGARCDRIVAGVLRRLKAS
jgi:RNA polymerase sigma-70 factor (ECF subfamily)